LLLASIPEQQGYFFPSIFDFVLLAVPLGFIPTAVEKTARLRIGSQGRDSMRAAVAHLDFTLTSIQP
jgi:hypothetical protein